ncbi:unnamed protein product, partial [Pleuronectes platessa]
EHTSEESILRRQLTSENMKSVILALLVVLVVGHSEALKCNCSVSSLCSGSIQTCSGSDQVCISFRFTPLLPILPEMQWEQLIVNC